MKGLANVALWAGIISLVIGVVLRLRVRPIALGLEPSSFLQLSIACLLLAIALAAVSCKEGK